MAQQIDAARSATAEGPEDAAPSAAPAAVDTAYACLLPFRVTGARPPLFLVPPASGVAFPYMRLAATLGDDQPVYGLQDPRLEEGGVRFENLEALAAHYAGAMRAVQPTGPYLVAGWSFGGLVAFETARQLEAEGEEVAFVGLLDSAPIGHARRGSQKRASRVLKSLVSGLMYLAYLRYAAPFVRQGFALFLAGMAERMMGESRPSGGGTRRGAFMSVSIAWRLFRVMRANVREGADYEPGTYGGPVALFWTGSERTVDGPESAWSGHAKGGVTVYEVSGDHASMMKAPHIDRLAEAFQRAMGDAPER
jgi:thioesterase domain-containing protein